MSEGLLGGHVNTDDVQATCAQGSNAGESCPPLLLQFLLPTWTPRTHWGLNPSWATAHQQCGCGYTHSGGQFAHTCIVYHQKPYFSQGRGCMSFFHKYLLRTWCRKTSCVMPWAAPSLHGRKRLRFQPATIWPTSPALDSFLEQNLYPEASLLSLYLTRSTKLPPPYSFNGLLLLQGVGNDDSPFSFVLMLVSSLDFLSKMTIGRRTGKDVFNSLFWRTCWHIYILQIVHHIRVRPAACPICSSFCVV